MWENLKGKKLGFIFRRQYPVESYFLDFYCAKAKLCVEVDGEQHIFRRERDARRDQVLSDIGILTLRVPSLDLFDETGMMREKWRLEIVRLCEERTGQSPG